MHTIVMHVNQFNARLLNLVITQPLTVFYTAVAACDVLNIGSKIYTVLI